MTALDLLLSDPWLLAALIMGVVFALLLGIGMMIEKKEYDEQQYRRR